VGNWGASPTLQADPCLTPAALGNFLRCGDLGGERLGWGGDELIWGVAFSARLCVCSLSPILVRV
jgi:hypothetical protein